jgi:hypothetical protein
MKLAQALFEIVSGFNRYTVRFKREYVVVQVNSNELRRFENLDGRYKPCMTHSVDLIRQATEKPPQSNQAAQRRNKDARPLTVFHG